MHQIYSVYTEVVIICLRSLMLTYIRITFHNAVFNHVIAAHTNVHLSDIRFCFYQLTKRSAQ